MKTRYIIGIDLGTTNSALGYIDLHDITPGAINIKTFEIPQLVSRALVAPRPSLPSFLYLPGEYDLEPGATALPWDEDRRYAVGEFARDQGALVPNRLVSSAKSWLCHGGVDRKAKILPWGAGDEVEKVSPVEASSRYLAHIKEAWNYKMPEPLERQQIILTVPASFDEVARELTLEAARLAGLENITLLEEPLAAFYAWLADHEKDWQENIKDKDLILVCDVGGGTTDFTLIGAKVTEQGPVLERLAVGDHLLLGGDNMDLALAAIVEKSLKTKLDAARWQTLAHQCRAAKERLLTQDDLSEVTIRLTGRGRSLIGGSLIAKLQKDEVLNLLLDGFFPKVELSEGERLGEEDIALREMGLPYCSDPAITKHLARFLLRQGQGKIPTLILFNGGALKPEIVQSRVLEVLESWGNKKIGTLTSRSLDLAISLGAAYYGLVKRGLGLKIGGGCARAYFVGIQARGKEQAVCLIERGSQEGEDFEIEKDFGVQTNRPVKFTLYCSTTRQNDKLGDVVFVDSDDFVKLPPVQTVLKYGKKGKIDTIPVRVGAKLTEIGTLELYCRSINTPHRWRLQFNLRKEEKRPISQQLEGVRVVSKKRQDDENRLTDLDLKAIERAKELLDRCFRAKDQKEAIKPSQLAKLLPQAIEMERDLWPLPILRALCDHLIELSPQRAKSPSYESRWFNLTGFCLRPGAGEATDPWRIKALWPLFFKGLFFAKDQQCRHEWWIFWRRIAAGLTKGQQEQLLSLMTPVLIPKTSKRRKRKQKAIKVNKEERRQMWLTASCLERLDIDKKIELGRALLKEVLRAPKWTQGLWALSRIGARNLFYGPADKVVGASEVLSWIDEIKKNDQLSPKAVISAVVSMARLTGDRYRDIPESYLSELITWLNMLGASKEQLLPLKEVKTGLDQKEKIEMFGESLPEGLVLTGN